MNPADDFFAIAKIVRARGFKGEVIADVLTDFPERFTQTNDAGDQIVGIWPTGEMKPVDIETAWFQKERVVLKLAGCDTEEAAESHRGVVLAVTREQLSELPEDTWYQADLVGCDVVSGNVRIGSVERVEQYGAAPLLVVKTETGGQESGVRGQGSEKTRDTSSREVLIPLTLSICKEIDVERKRITIEPPEGLLEL